MLLWEQPDDGLAFEDLLKLEDDREPITAATPAATYPCGVQWPQKSAEEKVRELSQRLEREVHATQWLVKQLDEMAHSAAKWRTRCYTRLGLAYCVGFWCGFCLVAIAWWAL